MEGGVEKGKSRNFGHLKGVETVKKLLKLQLSLKYLLSLFMFFHQKIGKGRKMKKVIYSNL